MSPIQPWTFMSKISFKISGFSSSGLKWIGLKNVEYASCTKRAIQWDLPNYVQANASKWTSSSCLFLSTRRSTTLSIKQEWAWTMPQLALSKATRAIFHSTCRISDLWVLVFFFDSRKIITTLYPTLVRTPRMRMGHGALLVTDSFAVVQKL